MGCSAAIGKILASVTRLGGEPFRQTRSAAQPQFLTATISNDTSVMAQLRFRLHRGSEGAFLAAGRVGV